MMQRPGHYIDLTAPDGSPVRSYVVAPAGPALGAVVVLQHMDQRQPPRRRGGSPRFPPLPDHRPGVNPHARQAAEDFACAGYLAIAPSTFGRGVSGTDYGYRFDGSPWGPRLVRPLTALRSEGVLLDIQAALGHAARLAPRVRVGLVGYCWGALLAWRAACQLPGVAATVCHYGGGMEQAAERLRAPGGPVLVHFATDPRWVSAEGVQAFRQAHSPGGPEHLPNLAIRIQPGRYGFMQVDHDAYDPLLTAQVQGETLEFLSRHLQGPALPG